MRLKILLAVIAALFLATAALPTPATASSAPSARPVVKMVTTRGTIYVALYPEYAPLSCKNFIKLVKKGFYNGLTFHRIADLGSTDPSYVPGRTLGKAGSMKIIQGGDPEGNGQGGPGYNIKGEFAHNGVNNPLVHNAGAVAMARSRSYDSAGSQFYICINAVHFLDNDYAVFGKVTKGLDIADKLKVGDKMTRVTMVK